MARRPDDFYNLFNPVDASRCVDDWVDYAGACEKRAWLFGAATTLLAGFLAGAVVGIALAVWQDHAYYDAPPPAPKEIEI